MSVSDKMDADILSLINRFLSSVRDTAKLLVLSKTVGKLTCYRPMWVNIATQGILDRIYVRELRLDFVILDRLVMPGLVHLDLYMSSIGELIAPDLVSLRLKESVCPPPTCVEILEYKRSEIPRFLILPNLRKLVISWCQVTGPSWKLDNLEVLILRNLHEGSYLCVTLFAKLKHLRVLSARTVYGYSDSLESIRVDNTGLRLTAPRLKYCWLDQYVEVLDNYTISYDGGYIQVSPRLELFGKRGEILDLNMFPNLKLIYERDQWKQVCSNEIITSKDAHIDVLTHLPIDLEELKSELRNYTISDEPTDLCGLPKAVCIWDKNCFNVHLDHVIKLEAIGVNFTNYSFPRLLKLESIVSWFDGKIIPYAPSLESLSIVTSSKDMKPLEELTKLKLLQCKNCECDKLRNDNVTKVVLDNCTVETAIFQNAKIIKITSSHIKSLIVPNVDKVVLDDCDIGHFIGYPVILKKSPHFVKFIMPRDLRKSVRVLMTHSLSDVTKYPNLLGAHVMYADAVIPKNLKYLGVKYYSRYFFDAPGLMALNIMSGLTSEEAEILKQCIKYVNVQYNLTPGGF